MHGVLGVTTVTGEELNSGPDAPRDAVTDALGLGGVGRGLGSGLLLLSRTIASTTPSRK